ncbi:MAG TPA: outer membrane beta-barrel protein [Gemmatimonadaceae bacterium]|nr:outer membrane beta-barrel protein [Gemmatimonadaceae bacterium]
MRTPIVIAALAASVGLASSASAQVAAPPVANGTAFELTPYAGYMIFGDYLKGPLGTSISNAPGAIYGVQLGMKIYPNVSLIGNLGYTSSDITAGIPFLGGYSIAHSSTLLYDGGLQLDLPLTTASGFGLKPFAQVGAGAMRYNISESIIQTNTTNFAANVGLGADVSLGQSMGLRLMAKDYIGKFNFQGATDLDVQGQTAQNWALSAGLRFNF